MQHIASTDISIPGSTPALVDGNHLFLLVFDLNRKMKVALLKAIMTDSTSQKQNHQ
jgi:hypothetical protein